MDNNNNLSIVVVGGGLVGSTFACLAANHGFNVKLIDQSNFSKMTSDDFDGRASAISKSSKLLLENLNIWKDLIDELQPIWQIRVSEENSKNYLHFNSNDYGEEPLGYMVENRSLRKAIIKTIGEFPNISVYESTKVVKVEADSSESKVLLDNNQNISCKLVVAADGRNSSLRAMSNINCSFTDYNQVALVTSVEHEFSHNGIAHERFRPLGPFAILPLKGNLSSLVWVESTKNGNFLFNQSDEKFLIELERRFGNFLGSLKLAGPRWKYDLSLMHANKYFGRRLVLIGDAAHSIHPLAGQNLNLSFSDSKVLINELVEAAKVGLDIGNEDILSAYYHQRKNKNSTFAFATGGLNFLFSNNIVPVKFTRGLGLSIVNKIPLLKQFFINYAGGAI
tara:strand:+ start:431 stop:1612 length:1182 start_codon:yes stop_codon:yes gene_type:complete